MALITILNVVIYQYKISTLHQSLS